MDPTPQPPVVQPAATDPGKGLAIAGLILAFFISIVGIILSAVALYKSKKAGFKNTIAVVGLIVGIVVTVVVTPITFIVAYNGVSTVADAHQACSQQDSAGTVIVAGIMYTCSPFAPMDMTSN